MEKDGKTQRSEGEKKKTRDGEGVREGTNPTATAEFNLPSQRHETHTNALLHSRHMAVHQDDENLSSSPCTLLHSIGCSIARFLDYFGTWWFLQEKYPHSYAVHMYIYIYSIDLEPCLPSESISQTPAWFLWCNLPCPDDMQNGHGYQTGLHRKWTANCLPPSKTPPVRSLYNFGWS